MVYLNGSRQATSPPSWVSSEARLDHLPPVSRWVTEAGVHIAVAARGLLRELDAYGMQALVGGAAVIYAQHERRHRAFGHNRVHRLRRRLVKHRRTWLEEAELQRGLVRMLYREPAIVAVPHIRVDAKSELPDVERQCLVLISHV